MMWLDIHDKSRTVGMALAFIAIGAWADGIWNGTGGMAWLHKKAAEAEHFEKVVIPQYRGKLIKISEEIRAAESENHELLRAISSAQTVESVTVTSALNKHLTPTYCPDRSDFIADEINEAYRLGLKDGAKR